MSSSKPSKLAAVSFLVGEGNPAEEDDVTASLITKEECNIRPETSLEPLLTENRESDNDEPIEMHPNLLARKRSLNSIHDSKQFVVDLYQFNEATFSKPNEHWVEKSRFIRYVEDCEGYDNHFGRPHVPCIPMEDFQHLKAVTNKAIILNNVEYTDFESFNNFIETNISDIEFPNIGSTIKEMLEMRQHEFNMHREAHMFRSSSSQSIAHYHHKYHPRNMMSVPNNLAEMTHSPRKLTTAFSNLKLGSWIGRIEPPDEEHWSDLHEEVLIVAGRMSNVTLCRLVMIRFKEPTGIKEIFDLYRKIRFIFFLVGPEVDDVNYVDVAKSLGAVISNPAFGGYFNLVETPDHIRQAIDRYLASTIVIAPGKIDNNQLLAGNQIRKIVNNRADHQFVQITTKACKKNTEMNIKPELHEVEKKTRSTRPCAGFIEDCRRFKNRYWSDWTDSWNRQCIFAVLIMLWSSVAPTLTFGAMMSDGTQGLMGPYECLLAQSIASFLWSIFSGQPMMIMSTTGPFVVYEESIFALCESHGCRFFVVRFYTSCFVLIYALMTVIVNGTRIVEYVTSFTEEIFSVLISLIFVNGAVAFFRREWRRHHVEDLDYYIEMASKCMEIDPMNATDIIPVDCESLSNPNAFLLEVLIGITAFSLCMGLRLFSRSQWFGRNFRNICGDFGITFSIFVTRAVAVYLFGNIVIDKIQVSTTDLVKRHERGHGWFITITHVTYSELLISSGIAAIFFLLLFIEVEIPEQMLLRADRKLKKGGARDWDLITVPVVNILLSAIGLPWMCPAAVQSLAHVSALTVRRKKAPGEPAEPVGVIEQRGTNFALAILLGCVAYVFRYIAFQSAILYAVFVYLGLMNLVGNQLILRIQMLFLPPKYRPHTRFTDVVPFNKVVGYTFIQIFCVVILFVVKQIHETALIFPLVLCSFIIVRYQILPCFYGTEELHALDGEETEEAVVDSQETGEDVYFRSRIPL